MRYRIAKPLTAFGAVAAIAVRGRHDPVLAGQNRGLGAVADAHPLEDRRRVRLQLLVRELEAVGGGLFGEPLRDEAEDLRLAIGEPGRALLASLAQHRARRLRR